MPPSFIQTVAGQRFLANVASIARSLATLARVGETIEREINENNNPENKQEDK